MERAEDYVHSVPEHDLDATIKIAWRMRARFKEAQATGRENLRFVRLINNPGALAAEARNAFLDILRQRGTSHPAIYLLSRHCIQVAILDQVPTTLDSQASVAVPLQVLIASTNVEAYWFASEAWVARVTPNMDAAVGALEPSQREDREEGALIISASREAYNARSYRTIRNSAGQIRDLIRMPDMVDFSAGNAPLFWNLFEAAAAIATRNKDAGSGPVSAAAAEDAAVNVVVDALLKDRKTDG